MKKLQLVRVGLSRVPRTPKPMELGMDLINDCNFRCKYCFTKIYTDERIQQILGLKMMPDDAVHILKDAWELGCRVVNLGGLGEPSIHPSFYQYLSWAKDIGYKIVVTTNGWKINPSRLDMLDERDWIQFSIDKMHLEGSPNPKKYLEKMMFQLDESIYKTYNILVKMHGESTPEIDKMLKETSIRVVKYPLLENYPPNTYPSENSPMIKCISPWHTLFVSPDLKINLCCSARGYTIADAKEAHSLRDIWYGESMNAARYKILSNNPPYVCTICPRWHRGIMDWLGAYLNTYWIKK